MAGGIKVVRAGADVARAAAYDYAINSEWPTLNIIAQGEVDIPSGVDPSATIFQHNLGHYAPFLFFEYYWEYDYNTFEKIYDRSRMRILQGGARSAVLNYRDRLSKSPFSSDSVRGYYFLFDYNLEEKFRPDGNIASLPGKVVPGDFGLKSLLDSSPNTIDSNSLDDFSATTRARSLAIHLNDKQTIPTSVNLLEERHSLGYLPTTYIYMKNPFLDAIEFVVNKVRADNSRMRVTGAQSALGGEFYYMITKDPFVLDIP